MKDWAHEPVRVAAVEVDDEVEIYDERTGQIEPHYDLTFDKESWERIREGRVCAICLEPQAEAYPRNEAHLPGCGFEPNGIKERQQDYLAATFKGEKWIGPRTSIAEELEIAQEMRETEKRAARAGIVIPRGI